ncbi:MAG TPA: YlbF family regulator [Tepidisphaeraceae bacterium]|jgi:cell fate (sporulation/competence/biofilm development) regulator YlbF (YheA/YmcA/DUF963 family)|nr:YlbF family regulator [Tepidisphaeraceae bacterium]
MPADINDILSLATQLGDLVASHPAVNKYKDAQKLVSTDPDATRLLSEFDRQIESLSRQESTGMPVTDAQRRSLETLQSQIMSHIKIKNLNMAQVDFVDLLRKVNQTWQSKLTDANGAAAGARLG